MQLAMQTQAAAKRFELFGLKMPADNRVSYSIRKNKTGRDAPFCFSGGDEED
jgi:hypothetical protein